MSHNLCHTLAQFLFHSHSVSVRGISSELATRASRGSDSHVTSRPPRLRPIRGYIEGIFTEYKARGIQVSRWQGRRACSLAAELAAWLDAKWPRVVLLKCRACLLDLTISLRLSLAISEEQSLKKMGFSWASWTSRMAKSIVVRFVVRKGNLMKNMEERLMASGHPVSWWTVQAHRYLTNVAEVKATQNQVYDST